MDNSKLIMISVRCQTKVHNVQSFGWGYTSQTNRKKRRQMQLSTLTMFTPY